MFASESSESLDIRFPTLITRGPSSTFAAVPHEDVERKRTPSPALGISGAITSERPLPIL